MRFAARLAENLHPLSISRASDIVIGAPLAGNDTRPAIPYTLDFATGRTIHALGADPQEAARATFHYQHLRTHLAGVEMEEFGTRPDPEPGSDPVFIFSPGRCGSTLLAKAARAIGLACLSEPDIYTATALHTVAHGMTRKGRNAYIAASRRLLAPFPAPVLVKLRSQCCSHPEVLLTACGQKPRVIFLTRNFVDWGVSSSRALQFTPEQNAMRIRNAIRPLGLLKQKADVLVLAYEALSGPQAYGQIEAFLGRPAADKARLGEVLARDSQMYTVLARSGAAPANTDTLRQAHAALWKQIRPQLPFSQEEIAPFEP